jgi:hypothetical protein
MHTQSVLDVASMRSATQRDRGSRSKAQRSASPLTYRHTELLPPLAAACFTGPTPDVEGHRTGARTMGQDMRPEASGGPTVKKQMISYDRMLFSVFFGSTMYFMLNYGFLFKAG